MGFNSGFKGLSRIREEGSQIILTHVQRLLPSRSKCPKLQLKRQHMSTHVNDLETRSRLCARVMCDDVTHSLTVN